MNDVLRIYWSQSNPRNQLCLGKSSQLSNLSVSCTSWGSSLPDFRGDSRLFLFWSRRVVRLSASVWRTRRSEKDERDTTRRKAPLTDRPTRTLPYPLFFGPRRKGFGRGQDPFARKLWNYAATHGGPSLFWDCPSRWTRLVMDCAYLVSVSAREQWR